MPLIESWIFVVGKNSEDVQIAGNFSFDYTELLAFVSPVHFHHYVKKTILLLSKDKF